MLEESELTGEHGRQIQIQIQAQRATANLFETTSDVEPNLDEGNEDG